MFCDLNCFSLWEILQTLYFVMYGLIDVKTFQLKEDHTVTEFIGKLMFGAYNAITIIVLLNMLIAMLTNSYTLIYVRLNAACFMSYSVVLLSTIEPQKVTF